MKVCIIRNAEARTNAGIIRIIDALNESGHIPLLLTRSRFIQSNKKIHKGSFEFKESQVRNYEIQLPSDMGKGIWNLFQLILFQYLVFKWCILNYRKYDLIHVFDLDAGLPVLVASLFLRKHFVYHIADFYVDSRSGIPRLFKKIIRKLEYLVISRAEATIVCTEERIEQINGSKPKKIVVIHNSPSEDKIISNLADNLTSNDSISVCYVGDLSDRRFIRSSINIIKQNNRFKLDIAGMGPLQDYVAVTVEDIPNIKFYGRVDYKEALLLYSKCDVMFAVYDPSVPNHRYSAPNKVYEAMMLGKPIIVSRNTGIDKLVEKENIGVAIDYAENDFRDALNSFLNNPSKLIEMSNNAKKAFKTYSWANMRQKVAAIYQVIENNQRYKK